ncbi:MAG: biopolymer transporter ExbD [Pseudomonadota bacterium]
MAVSAGKSGDLNADINVTPLVDVMLVLLVVFMVTAPLLQTGVDLELPQAEASVLPSDEGRLILSIDRSGGLYLSGASLRWEDLEIKLRTNEKIKTEKELYIEADKNLAYGLVLKAMALARKAGVARLMMLTDPLESGQEEPVPQ